RIGVRVAKVGPPPPAAPSACAAATAAADNEEAPARWSRVRRVRSMVMRAPFDDRLSEAILAPIRSLPWPNIRPDGRLSQMSRWPFRNQRDVWSGQPFQRLEMTMTRDAAAI